MNRITHSVRDFSTGLICFLANLLVTLLGITIANIQFRQATAIIIIQVGLFIVTMRSWSSRAVEYRKGNP